MTSLLKIILRFLAILTLKKYKPGIIAVTGSVGKTSVKEAIFAVLKNFRQTRAASGNFNNELGVPLTILSAEREIKGLFFWPRIIIAAFWHLTVRQDNYPELLVLEYAADRPGDIRYLLGIARPQIGVVTAIGAVPVHVEFYAGPEAVAKEKGRLIESLPPTGWAVLNADDEAALTFKEKSAAPVLTFGFSPQAEIKISRLETKNEGGFWWTAFKLEHQRTMVPVRLNELTGVSHAYAAAAAAGVGLIYGINLVRAAENLIFYEPPPHRGQVLSGIKASSIIDDSYNASPLSMRAALENLKKIDCRRRIAVLGDMLELGQYAIEAHEEIGRLAASAVQSLVTVGLRAKVLAGAAKKAGLSGERVMSFDTAGEAARAVQTLINPGDVVLVKASRGIGLDKIVEEIRQL